MIVLAERLEEIAEDDAEAEDARTLLAGIPAPLDDLPPVATVGRPQNLSPWTRRLLTQDCEGSDERWLNASHLNGLEPAEADLALALARWTRAIEEILHGPLGAVPMAARDPKDGGFDDLAGRKSAHQRLAQEARAGGLLPPYLPNAWRIQLRHTW